VRRHVDRRVDPRRAGDEHEPWILAIERSTSGLERVPIELVGRDVRELLMYDWLYVSIDAGSEAVGQ
jgi:hypothetical protein